jgi:perosamine synthetase
MKESESLAALLGGKPTRTKPLLSRTTMGAEERQAAIEVLDSDVLSAFIGGPGKHFLGGEKVREFEKAWADKYEFKHAISVNSWTTGLMVAVGAVGIEPGDEVICSPYTMSASATSILFYGGIPVFADIDPNSFCLDPKSIEKKITKRTKAIMVVHIFGGSADMDSIMEIAKKYNLKVIEDGAQSPGVYYKNRPVGAIGDIGGFSLNFHKHIHTGEGGMLVTNDDKVAFKAQLIRNHGENLAEQLNVEDLPNCIGSNYRLTELQAAIGIEQLKKLPNILNTRKTLTDYLSDELKQFPFLTTPKAPENGSSHAFYVYPLKFNSSVAGMSRSLFVKAVNAEFPPADGYESVPFTEGYVTPLYWNKIYQNKIAIGTKGFPFNFNVGVKYDYSRGICPIVEKMYLEEFICSPMIREPLGLADMDDLIVAIRKVIENKNQLVNKFGNKQVFEIFSPTTAAGNSNVR